MTGDAWSRFHPALAAGALLAAALVAACGGDQPTGPSDETPGPVPVASVTVTPGSAHVVVGSAVSFTAALTDRSGNPLTGRTVTWSSSDTSRATVSDGVVTGVGAGDVVIRATSEGKSGSATVTVDAATGVVAAGGWDQTGITGFALADSLRVRLFSADGTPVAGALVTWTASTGSVSPASGTTDASGYARTQWTVGEGTGTVSAAVEGEEPATFTATGKAPTACRLAPSTETQRFSLGPTDFALSLDASKPVRVVVLFVDFPDAQATESPDSLMAGIVTPGFALLQELSYGRVDITATPVKTWYRMSRPIGSYTWTTYDGHRAYITEAMTLADADVDFSRYDAVYIFAPPSQAQPVSPTFNGGQAGGVTFDGRIYGNGVTFGNDSRRWGPFVLAHETGHMFGLVDLYAFDPTGGDPFRGDQFRFTGSWTLMADIFRAGHYTAWEKRKLGWLKPSEYVCLHDGEGIEVVLDPVETPGGLKMVAMPTGSSTPAGTATVAVAEVRRRTGLDSHLCADGVLVYDVDATVPSGYGPLRIRGSRTHSGDCGPWSDATFDLGAGQVSDLTVANSFTMRLLDVDAAGRYRVRFQR